MARTNNLTNFLNDVSSAIKQKTGDSTPIPASEFDTEILSIETAGTYQSKSITIDSNGTQVITPDENYDAIEQLVITVNVPVSQLQSKAVTITSNGNISVLPDTDYNGMAQVDLTVSVPSQEINNQDKTITQNGAYTADSGYTGLGTVTVNVPSGSGDIKLFETEQAMQADPDASEGDLAVVYREELTGVTEESEFDSCTFPNTVVLDSAFSDDIYGSFRGTGSSLFDGTIDMSSSGFSFNGFGDKRIRVQYTSSDGITYTRTDGGEELQEFGTTIQWDSGMESFNSVIGNFMKIGGNYFEGMYEYKSNEYVMTKNQLDTTPDYVYEKTFYGKNGVESGTLTTGVSNSFTDVNAEVYAKIQVQYNNMQPRILTDQDKAIDSDIRIIPSKTDGTPLLDTSNVTDMRSMFSSCSNLTTIPLLNTSNVTNMNNMFNSCSNLTTIPLLDTKKVTNMGNMFYGCSSLNNESLNNILAMCANAVKITSKKTLKYIGLTQEQANICTTLSNYQDFVNAGWTTGY